MGRVLVVGATHGNERNAAWLMEHWRRHPHALERHGLAVDLVIGNPAAAREGRRYLDLDLNRCFQSALLADPSRNEREVQRARELLRLHGPEGRAPALVAIDLHSTTAAMGNSLVVYGRRPADLALAAALQLHLGLPIYLHEGDPAQTGFLVERWPSGLVVEVGPVPQGVLNPKISRQTALAVEATLELLALARRGSLPQPRALVVHRHLLSLDLPRHDDGSPRALIHPLRQGRDWQPLRSGEPLLLDATGSSLPYEPPAGLAGATVWPVFINEAAYGEKGIALSLTNREIWPVEPAWGTALSALAAGLSLL
jgi:aspartoacylase